MWVLANAPNATTLATPALVPAPIAPVAPPVGIDIKAVVPVPAQIHTTKMESVLFALHVITVANHAQHMPNVILVSHPKRDSLLLLHLTVSAKIDTTIQTSKLVLHAMPLASDVLEVQPTARLATPLPSELCQGQHA